MAKTCLFYSKDLSFLKECLEIALDINDLDYRFFVDVGKAKESLISQGVKCLVLPFSGLDSIRNGEMDLFPYAENIVLVGSHVSNKNNLSGLFPQKAFHYLSAPLNKTKLESILDEPVAHQVYLNCFGPFDVYVNDEPIQFHSKKAKELLAIMVSYPNNNLSLDFVISLLWPNHDTFLAKRLYRDASFRLRATLKEKGCENLVKFGHACCKIETSNATSDYWEYLKNGKGDYYGEYMSGYKWTGPLKSKLDTIKG